MKKIKNERGFTLIELLAVIVVLAIVLLMGAMAVIPRMNDARKQVFALEANTAIQAASTYLMNNALNPSASKQTYPVGDNVVCIPISTLISNGDFDADADKYSGRILVRKKAGTENGYLYIISMTNGTIMVDEKGVEGGKDGNNKDIVAANVEDYNGGDKPWTKASCGADQSADNALWPTK